jgi:predicted nuclease of restriction endonuclease-like (RecB) superfamily
MEKQSLPINSTEYRAWIIELKTKFRSIQLKAAVTVNKTQLHSIPWGHNLIIIGKCSSPNEAIYYVQNTLPNLSAFLNINSRNHYPTI